ncbi:hypothetical protein EUTSA_v10027421mg [Eutrema salsugineum]|uniref:Knottin scorpion toxin-like domain-containing protein n=1 Tax=Eutrema salsugineum TaxID=72664 RepID=V4MKE2_EUTSA|nr:defensin-like protein 90 [Eutrema salsugineum]ESQ53138.1 hypothetical protein EUTSA_v10027421mg [Eutrema salsugineum]
MATTKFSFFLLPLLMVFALIVLPMTSGQYFKCMDACTLTPPCADKCRAMGFSNGGECRIYSFGGVCCCQCTSKDCINPLLFNPPLYN